MDYEVFATEAEAQAVADGMTWSDARVESVPDVLHDVVAGLDGVEVEEPRRAGFVVSVAGGSPEADRRYLRADGFVR